MNRLCLGCMQVKYDTPICQHCGFDERTPNMPHQLPLGTVLQNRYVIGRVLGQGGFGITYIGWDKQTSSPVAIKEYFPGGVVQRYTTLSTTVSVINGDTQDVFAKHRNRFLTEAKTLSTLTGIPEIVQVKSWFPDNDTAYIVMEYVQGTTLKQHLRNLGRPMTEKEALDIMEPVLRALQKVHDHGLIHRDISPDNIMLPPSGGIKLIDFGTARYLDDSGKSKSTEAVLKPGFAPMEQYNTRGNIGPWTDVYALCATFHYLLTGKVAPDVHTRMEQGDALTMLRNRSNISKKLVQALEKGMKILPQNRIQSVAKLYAMLYAKPTVIPWKKLAAAGCAAVAAIAVAAVLLLMPEREAPEAPTQPVSGSAKEVTVPATTLPTEETTEATTEPEETTEATEETTAPTQAPKYQPSYDEYYGDDDSYSPPPADSPAPAPTEAPAPPPTEAPAPPPTEAPAPPPTEAPAPPPTEAPAPPPTLPDLPSYEDPNYGYDWT